jgi:hypothetical protein
MPSTKLKDFVTTIQQQLTPLTGQTPASKLAFMMSQAQTKTVQLAAKVLVGAVLPIGSA